MSTWRPEVARTAKRMAHRAGAPRALTAMALGGDRGLVGQRPVDRPWPCAPRRLKCSVRARLQATWDPAVSQRYVVWFEAAATSAGEGSAWVYDSATRRRRQLATLGGVLSLPSASGSRAAWCTTTLGGGPGIVAVDIRATNSSPWRPSTAYLLSRRRPRDVAEADGSHRHAGRVGARRPRPGPPLVDRAGRDAAQRPLSRLRPQVAPHRGGIRPRQADARPGRQQNVDDGVAQRRRRGDRRRVAAAAPSLDGGLVVWAECARTPRESGSGTTASAAAPAVTSRAALSMARAINAPAIFHLVARSRAEACTSGPTRRGFPSRSLEPRRSLAADERPLTSVTLATARGGGAQHHAGLGDMAASSTCRATATRDDGTSIRLAEAGTFSYQVLQAGCRAGRRTSVTSSPGSSTLNADGATAKKSAAGEFAPRGRHDAAQRHQHGCQVRRRDGDAATVEAALPRTRRLLGHGARVLVAQRALARPWSRRRTGRRLHARRVEGVKPGRPSPPVLPAPSPAIRRAE